MTLDLDLVRSQFPSLGGPWVFFDNAGGSQILGSVVERIRAYLLTSNVQLGASYAVSRAAAERVAAATAALAGLLNAADPSEIVVGGSTTQLLSNLAQAMPLLPGDEVIVTDCDHEANIGPWRRLAARGVVIKEWTVEPDTLALASASLDRLLTARTRLVCFTHASNLLGTIHPVAELARQIHARGAQVLVDGVAFAPHRRVDVRALDVDYYVVSLYKTYGPHLAALYGRRDRLETLGNLNHFFLDGEIPYKLQPGNVNFELTYGAGAIAEYFDRLGPGAWDAIATHEEKLAARLLEFLTRKKGVRVWGETTSDRARRVPTVSFTVENRDSAEIPRAVDAHRIGIRFGDFYARRLVTRLGLTARHGVVRVSLVHYNTLEEVDRLVDVLDEAIR